MFLERILIGNLWNAVLICAIFALKHFVRNRISLRFQYYSWYVLLVSLLLPFFPSYLWKEWTFATHNTSQSLATYNLTSSNTVVTNSTQWLEDATQLIIGDDGNTHIKFYILVMWFIGVLTILAFYWCGSYRLRQIQNFAMPPSINVQDIFDKCCQKLRIRKKIHIRQSRFITVPVSFGWKKPFVVLPKQGIEKLPASELENVVMHELTHIRHGDLITNYLFCGIQALCCVILNSLCKKIFLFLYGSIRATPLK